jgi:predicted CopG family antitoxin
MKTKRSSFSDLLDQIGRMTEDDQTALVEIVRRRLIEQRRSDIARDISEANADFKAGRCRVGTPDEIMREILS